MVTVTAVVVILVVVNTLLLVIMAVIFVPIRWWGVIVDDYCDNIDGSINGDCGSDVCWC